MNPALSVIFFTVLSGAGYGLFIALAVGGLLSEAIAQRTGVVACIVGLTLVTIGLLSSTLHLANPKNAWRAFSRFRTSWLSREGVLAIIFYLPGSLYLSLWWFGSTYSIRWVLVSLSVIVAASATVFCTGMIYACLKTIRQWNTALTPANYILISLMQGALLLLLLMADNGDAIRAYLVVTLFLIMLAMLMKLIYYGWIDKSTGPTIQTATGFTNAQIRLLDPGHTAGTFLTSEFNYQVNRQTLIILRGVVLLLAFILPWILMFMMIIDVLNAFIGTKVAVVLSFAGIMIERWLFFCEARHVVNLYHGHSD